MIERNLCKEFTVFLTKLVFNASIDYRRKLIRIKEREQEITLDIENKVSLSNTGKGTFCFMEENVVSDEIEKIFELEEHYKAMKPLTKKQKEVIDLFVLKGLSVEEVAKIMGISESDVTTTKNRAIEKFKKNLRGM